MRGVQQEISKSVRKRQVQRSCVSRRFDQQLRALRLQLLGKSMKSFSSDSQNTIRLELRLILAQFKSGAGVRDTVADDDPSPEQYAVAELLSS